MTEQMRAQRSRALFEVVRKELRLVGGHVDADWTFGLARFAREAQIQRVLDFFTLPSVSNGLSTKHFEQKMRATAGRMLLVTRDHVTWAHRAFARLAAFAHSDAAKRRSCDA